MNITETRRLLHEHPQTAGNEQFAHDMVVRHLQGLHPDKVYTNVGGWGVIAVWGKDPQRATTAFRADTDALPIGHRCGHDGHTSILLRLAEMVDRLRDFETSRLRVGETSRHQDFETSSRRDSEALGHRCDGLQQTGNNIILVWQPAEETGEGARAVLESGILQQYNIRAFYALHNLPGYPLGTVVVCPKTFAAASTGVIYHLEGRETHASTPEMGVNPGLAVSEIIQRFAAFNGNGGEFRQSTLICVQVGSPAFGTSAGRAEVMFTLRAFTNDAMERLLKEANGTVDEVAARYGLMVSRMLQEPFRATENHAECVEVLMRELGTMPMVVKEDPFRWSEDFAEYLLQFPGAMFGIGSGENHPELHHPDYDFPDELIDIAAAAFGKLAGC